MRIKVLGYSNPGAKDENNDDDNDNGDDGIFCTSD